MEFNKIIAVNGKPGLFQVISQSKSTIIVTSLTDHKKIAISTTKSVNLLEKIAIYTYEEDISLLDVLKAMFEKTAGKEAISHKESGEKLTAFFTEVLPEYDTERVYTSNIKKIIQWFNILVKSGMDFSKTGVATEEV